MGQKSQQRLMNANRGAGAIKQFKSRLIARAPIGNGIALLLLAAIHLTPLPQKIKRKAAYGLGKIYFEQGLVKLKRIVAYFGEDQIPEEYLPSCYKVIRKFTKASKYIGHVINNKFPQEDRMAIMGKYLFAQICYFAAIIEKLKGDLRENKTIYGHFKRAAIYCEKALVFDLNIKLRFEIEFLKAWALVEIGKSEKILKVFRDILKLVEVSAETLHSEYGMPVTGMFATQAILLLNYVELAFESNDFIYQNRNNEEFLVENYRFLSKLLFLRHNIILKWSQAFEVDQNALKKPIEYLELAFYTDQMQCQGKNAVSIGKELARRYMDNSKFCKKYNLGVKPKYSKRLEFAKQIKEPGVHGEGQVQHLELLLEDRMHLKFFKKWSFTNQNMGVDIDEYLPFSFIRAIASIVKYKLREFMLKL